MKKIYTFSVEGMPENFVPDLDFLNDAIADNINEQIFDTGSYDDHDEEIVVKVQKTI